MAADSAFSGPVTRLDATGAVVCGDTFLPYFRLRRSAVTGVDGSGRLRIGDVVTGSRRAAGAAGEEDGAAASHAGGRLPFLAVRVSKVEPAAPRDGKSDGTAAAAAGAAGATGAAAPPASQSSKGRHGTASAATAAPPAAAAVASQGAAASATAHAPPPGVPAAHAEDMARILAASLDPRGTLASQYMHAVPGELQGLMREVVTAYGGVGQFVMAFPHLLTRAREGSTWTLFPAAAAVGPAAAAPVAAPVATPAHGKAGGAVAAAAAAERPRNNTSQQSKPTVMAPAAPATSPGSPSGGSPNLGNPKDPAVQRAASTLHASVSAMTGSRVPVSKYIHCLPKGKGGRSDVRDVVARCGGLAKFVDMFPTLFARIGTGLIIASSQPYGGSEQRTTDMQLAAALKDGMMRSVGFGQMLASRYLDCVGDGLRSELKHQVHAAGGLPKWLSQFPDMFTATMDGTVLHICVVDPTAPVSACVSETTSPASSPEPPAPAARKDVPTPAAALATRPVGSVQIMQRPVAAPAPAPTPAPAVAAPVHASVAASAAPPAAAAQTAFAPVRAAVAHPAASQPPRPPVAQAVVPAVAAPVAASVTAPAAAVGTAPAVEASNGARVPLPAILSMLVNDEDDSARYPWTSAAPRGGYGDIAGINRVTEDLIEPISSLSLHGKFRDKLQAEASVSISLSSTVVAPSDHVIVSLSGPPPKAPHNTDYVGMYRADYRNSEKPLVLKSFPLPPNMGWKAEYNRRIKFFPHRAAGLYDFRVFSGDESGPDYSTMVTRSELLRVEVQGDALVEELKFRSGRLSKSGFAETPIPRDEVFKAPYGVGVMLGLLQRVRVMPTTPRARRILTETLTVTHQQAMALCRILDTEDPDSLCTAEPPRPSREELKLAEEETGVGDAELDGDAGAAVGSGGGDAAGAGGGAAAAKGASDRSHLTPEGHPLKAAVRFVHLQFRSMVCECLENPHLHKSLAGDMLMWLDAIRKQFCPVCSRLWPLEAESGDLYGAKLLHHVQTVHCADSPVGVRLPTDAGYLTPVLDGLVHLSLPALVPAPDRERRQRALLERLTAAVKGLPFAFTLNMFGSCVNGFQTRGSDVDVCLVRSKRGPGSDAPEISPREAIEAVAKVLQEAGYPDIEVRATARVPIVAFSDPVSGLHCDMCAFNHLPLRNSALLYTYSLCDDRVRQLGYIIKYWARRRGINNAQAHTLSSYGYLMLLIRYLQQIGMLPCLQMLPAGWRGEPVEPPSEGSPRIPVVPIRNAVEEVWDAYFYHEDSRMLQTYAARCPATVGQLLLGFFWEYGFNFDVARHVVSIRPEAQPLRGALRNVLRVEKVEASGWHSRPILSIEDPFERNFDVAHTLTESTWRQIKGEFVRSYAILRGSIGDPQRLGEDLFQPVASESDSDSEMEPVMMRIHD